MQSDRLPPLGLPGCGLSSGRGAAQRSAGHVELGRLSVTGLEAEARCDAQAFLPLTLPEGISATDDPLLHARAAAYCVSLARRSGH